MATESAVDQPPGVAEHLQPSDRVHLLRTMLLMRGIEERAMSLYRQGKVPGSFYDGYRAGGRVGGRRVRDGARGPLVRAAPRPRSAPRPRRLADPDPGPVHGSGGRHHRRPRRQRPFRRLAARMRRDGLDAARHDARRDGHGDGLQAARRAPLRAHVVRGRLDLAGRLPRGDELGGRTAAARRVRAREQPVRVFDPAREAVRRRSGRAGGRVRSPRRHR